MDFCSLSHQLSQKTAALHTAQGKVKSMQGLVSELEDKLDQEKEERENQIAIWQQTMTSLHAQVDIYVYTMSRLHLVSANVHSLL